MVSNSKRRFNKKRVYGALGILGIISGLCVACFVAGFNYRDRSAKRQIDEVKVKYESAYYITLDEDGAWLGDIPGQKFYPLYDSAGNRLGAPQ